MRGWDSGPGEFDEPLIATNIDFAYPAQITKMTNIFRTVIAGGDRRDALIWSLNDYRGSDVPTANIPPKQGARMTPAMAEGMAQAEKAEKQEAMRQQLMKRLRPPFKKSFLNK